MSALLILLVLGIWGAALYFSAFFLTFFIKKKWLRHLIGAVAVVALFTLPVRDEIKGAEEFEALCKTGGVYQISPNAVGKKFDLKITYTENKTLPGYSRPVEESIKTYTDIATGEVIATSKAYIAKGGWLVQKGWIRNSGGGDGALNGRPQCFPPSDLAQANRLQAITNKIVN